MIMVVHALSMVPQTTISVTVFTTIQDRTAPVYIYLMNIVFPVTCIPLECGHTCPDGYMVTATCDGCQLNDTCIANTPCQHDGTCTLNGSPDEYVCTCTGYYDGKNCQGNL